MNIYFSTLGCKTNQAEIGHLESLAENAGMTLCARPDDADVMVVNTCAVTARAEKKARGLFRRLRRNHPNATIVATGCMAESEGETLREYGVDRVIANAGKADLFTRIRENADALEPIETERMYREYPLPARQTGRTRAFMKVQDGCDAWCSYCIIPALRGTPRSRDAASIIDEMSRLVQDGYREIVLTGIHVGRYGTEPGADTDLPRLLEMIISLPGEFRVRITSLEPTEITDRLLDIIAGSGGRICPHIHVPLQSGADTVLARMNRTYTAAEYVETVRRITAKIPRATTGADVIVGFPGETDDEFHRTVETLRQASVDFLHVFSYSVRRNTAAADMPNHVPAHVIEKRAAHLRGIERELKHRAMSIADGTEAVVLSQSDNSGLTDTYLPVVFTEPVEPNRLVTARLFLPDGAKTLHAKVSS